MSTTNPTTTTTEGGGSRGSTTTRPTFHPPWVAKDTATTAAAAAACETSPAGKSKTRGAGPSPLPVPTTPCQLKKTPPTAAAAHKRQSLTRSQSKTSSDDEGGGPDEAHQPLRRHQKNPILAGVKLRKTSLTTSKQQQQQRDTPTTNNGNAHNDVTATPTTEDTTEQQQQQFKRPHLKPVPPKAEVSTKRDNKLPETVTLRKSTRLPQAAAAAAVAPTSTSSGSGSSNDENLEKAMPAKRHSVVRNESLRRLSGHIPAPPPMPTLSTPVAAAAPCASKHRRDRLEQLRNRPKNRPDWTAMLKEIESARRLRHVECNDRSQPLLPDTKSKVDQHFLYDSETANVHNVLLKQIEHGVKLRKVKTNDRSRPMLDGLRKFRRQMTIEEQLQKSQSMASVAAASATNLDADSKEAQGGAASEEPDEMDDIDKVRDDLQSTKQMLALELRTREAQQRENRRLQARIQNLEAELERQQRGGGNSQEAAEGATQRSADDRLIETLKAEVMQTKSAADEVEHKYRDVAQELDAVRVQLEEVRRQNQKLQEQHISLGKRQKPMSKVDMSLANGSSSAAQEAPGGESTSSDESDSDSDSDDKEATADEATVEERKLQKEVKHLRSRLRHLKHKQDNARKERSALRGILKRHQEAMRQEKRKYRALHKEVNKMAALMKDSDDDEDDEEVKGADDQSEGSSSSATEEEEEEEEDSTGASTADENKVEEEESSSASEDDDDDEEDGLEEQKGRLLGRAQRHETILGALKKGNFLLKTNAERLQDDLNRQKELTAQLQEDLDSVLAELG